MRNWRTDVLVLAVIAFTLILPIQPTQAAEWYTCRVDEAGPTGTKTVVKICLTDVAEAPAFEEKTAFTAQTGREKEMLAVALVALSNELKVRAQLDLNKKKVLALNAAAAEAQ